MKKLLKTLHICIDGVFKENTYEISDHRFDEMTGTLTFKMFNSNEEVTLKGTAFDGYSVTELEAQPENVNVSQQVVEQPVTQEVTQVVEQPVAQVVTPVTQVVEPTVVEEEFAPQVDAPQVGETNPFAFTATTEQPKVETNPFGQTQVESNPFGQTQVETNPFGQTQVESNPFAMEQTNTLNDSTNTAQTHSEPEKAETALPSQWSVFAAGSN